VNKLTTSTKMNYLGGMFDKKRWRRWVLGHMSGMVVYSGHCSGWPLRIKEIIMSSTFRVLLVQPYDIMGSVLIE
jgi:hypothetical protein